MKTKLISRRGGEGLVLVWVEKQPFQLCQVSLLHMHQAKA